MIVRIYIYDKRNICIDSIELLSQVQEYKGRRINYMEV